MGFDLVDLVWFGLIPIGLVKRSDLLYRLCFYNSEYSVRLGGMSLGLRIWILSRFRSILFWAYNYKTNIELYIVSHIIGRLLNMIDNNNRTIREVAIYLYL
jgi:hypothetical protein